MGAQEEEQAGFCMPNFTLVVVQLHTLHKVHTFAHQQSPGGVKLCKNKLSFPMSFAFWFI